MLRGGCSFLDTVNLLLLVPALLVMGSGVGKSYDGTISFDAGMNDLLICNVCSSFATQAKYLSSPSNTSRLFYMLECRNDSSLAADLSSDQINDVTIGILKFRCDSSCSRCEGESSLRINGSSAPALSVGAMSSSVGNSPMAEIELFPVSVNCCPHHAMKVLKSASSTSIVDGNPCPSAESPMLLNYPLPVGCYSDGGGEYFSSLLCDVNSQLSEFSWCPRGTSRFETGAQCLASGTTPFSCSGTNQINCSTVQVESTSYSVESSCSLVPKLCVTLSMTSENNRENSGTANDLTACTRQNILSIPKPFQAPPALLANPPQPIFRSDDDDMLICGECVRSTFEPTGKDESMILICNSSAMESSLGNLIGTWYHGCNSDCSSCQSKAPVELGQSLPLHGKGQLHQPVWTQCCPSSLIRRTYFPSENDCSSNGKKVGVSYDPYSCEVLLGEVSALFYKDDNIHLCHDLGVKLKNNGTQFGRTCDKSLSPRCFGSNSAPITGQCSLFEDGQHYYLSDIRTDAQRNMCVFFKVVPLSVDTTELPIERGMNKLVVGPRGSSTSLPAVYQSCWAASTSVPHPAIGNNELINSTSPTPTTTTIPARSGETPSPAAPKGTDSSLLIGASIAGCVVVVVCVLFVGFLCWRKRKAKRGDKTKASRYVTTEGDGEMQGSRGALTTTTLSIPQSDSLAQETHLHDSSELTSRQRRMRTALLGQESEDADLSRDVCGSSVPEKDEEDVHQEEPFKSIPFRKGKLIGSGGFGKVFLGYNENDGGFLAAKEIEIDGGDKMVTLLAREIVTMQRLEHPNVVKYLGVNRDQGESQRFYILMEYLPGGSLKSTIDGFGCISARVAARYTKQALDALVYLHGNGVVHRDLKTANMLLDRDGALKLSDLGSASQQAETVRSLHGTPLWLPPEAMLTKGQKLDYSSDIWALGCSVLEMLTGELPFFWLKGTPFQKMRMISAGGAPLADALSKIRAILEQGVSSTKRFTTEIDVQHDFIMKCLNPKPTERPSAEALLSHPFINAVEEWGTDVGREGSKARTSRRFSEGEETGNSNTREAHSFQVNQDETTRDQTGIIPESLAVQQFGGDSMLAGSIDEAVV